MKYNSPKNQEIKRNFVNREVLYNVSTLFYELGRCISNLEDEDEYYGLISVPDYASAIEYNNNCHVMYSNFFGGYVWINKTEHTISDSFSTEFEAQEDCCCMNDIEPDNIEVLEHWLVTDWFADKLKKHGEIVGEFMGLTVWGRCCTGQAILLDGVISRICEELEILEGQKYEW